MAKKVLVTSGNCIEKIDSVRKISNESSGKLGQLITNDLIKNNYKDIEKIYYVCSTQTLLPNENDKIEIIYADSCTDIFEVMKNLLTTVSIDIVIHARAISDYSVGFVTSLSKIEGMFNDETYWNEYKSYLEGLKTGYYNGKDSIKIDNSTKISSNEDDLIIKLTRNKKIINYIKQWNPNTVLIGFKLLDSVSTEELLDAARLQMQTNDCDFVVANDISQIRDNQHIAYIINKEDKEIMTLNTKEEIAREICDIVKYY